MHLRYVATPIFHLNVELWFDEQEVDNDDNLVLVEWNVVIGCSPQLAQHLIYYYRRRVKGLCHEMNIFLEANE